MFSVITGLLGGGGSTTSAAGGPSPVKSPTKQQTDGFFQEPKASDIEACVKTITTSENPDEMVSAIRRVAECVVYAEQRRVQPVIDLFFEKNVTGILRAVVLRPDTSVEIQTQILQTFSILAQSLKNEVNLFQFLSQNNLNLIIAHKFKFEEAPEELLAHYISLLKTVALRLDGTFCQFFYDARRNDGFPLYDRALDHFANEEPLVRAAVRSIVLMVHRVDDPAVDGYVCSHIEHFEMMCRFIRSRFVKLQEMIRDRNFADLNLLSKIDAAMCDVLDDFSFLQDVLGMREERQTAVQEFSSVFNSYILDPLLSALQDDLNVWGLAQCCLAMKNVRVLKYVHSKTFGGNDSRAIMFDENLSSSNECLALATTTLAFFFVDKIEEDQDFFSRKYRLNLVRGNADDSVFVNSMMESRSGTDEPPKSGEEEPKEHDLEATQVEARETSKSIIDDPPSSKLVSVLLRELEARTKRCGEQDGIPRPVLIRLLSKLLVHVSFDSRLLDEPAKFLSLDQAQTLRRAMANVAIGLTQIGTSSQDETMSTFIEAFEDEWRELKSGPLRVASLVTNPASVLLNLDDLISNMEKGKADGDDTKEGEERLIVLEKTEEETIQRFTDMLRVKVPLAFRTPLTATERLKALASMYMVLRLCRVSLEKEPDIFFPAVGNADVDSIREDSAIDLRKCEFLEMRVVTPNNLAKALDQSHKLLLVLVAGALVIVEADDDRRSTGVCKSVAPIHRVDVIPDSKEVSLVHLKIKSARRIGLSARVGSKQEWLLSIKFDGEPRAIFAQEQIKRAAKRAKDDKFKRIKEMLMQSELLVTSPIQAAEIQEPAVETVLSPEVDDSSR